MATLFLDSSAIIKQYVAEIGSTWIRNIVQLATGNTIVLSAIATVEVCSALARLRRMNQITPADELQSRGDFLFDVKSRYIMIGLDDALLNRAAFLPSQHQLRALDSIQLSCAIGSIITLHTTATFLSADNNLLLAASKEGFAIDNPLNHP